MSVRAHHQRKKCQRQAPSDSVLEVRECLPSTQEKSTVGPLGGGARGLGATLVNSKTSMVASGPPGAPVSIHYDEDMPFLDTATSSRTDTQTSFKYGKLVLIFFYQLF
jgi:hypothetical protein